MYRIKRNPIAPIMGGIIINSEGIIGVTLSIAYEGSSGGVTNGNEKIAWTFSMPRSFPSNR